MAKSYTTEQLISLVRRIGAFNDVGSEGKEDTDIMDALDEVMLSELAPVLIRVQEEYLVRTLPVTTTANQEHVDIPTRALANIIRDVWFQDGNQRRFIPLVNRENRPFYGIDASDTPDGVYMEGDHIVLVPKSSGGQQLNIAYTFRPNQLVKASAYRTIASVDSTTAVTLDSAVPAAWTTANTFDIHSKNSGAEVRSYDKGATTVSGTGITFSTAIDGSTSDSFAAEVGDYVCLAETAAIPSLPRELHPALAQAAACRLLESDGDAVALQLARQTLQRQIEAWTIMGECRIEGKGHRIVNRNSLLGRQTTRGGW